MQADVYKRYLPCWLPGAESFDKRAEGVPCPAQNPGAGDETPEELAEQAAERLRGKDYATYGEVWLPSGTNFLVKEDYRTREGFNTSFQWKDLDDTIQLTGEYIRSKSTLEWWEDAMKYQGGYKDTDRRIRPYGDSTFLFDSKGRFLAGDMSDGSGDWRASDKVGRQVDGEWLEASSTRHANSWESTPVQMQQFGQKFQLDTRGVYGESLVEDFSFNAKWTPNEAWTVELDVQHVDAELSNDDMTLHLGVFGLQSVDLRGKTPSMSLSEPWGGARDENRDAWLAAFPTGVPGFSDDPQGDANYFTDPTSYWWRSGMSHYERSEGTSDAVRLDVTHEFEDAGALRKVKAGVRWAEREQTVRSTGWGWGAVAPEWSDGRLYIDHTPDQASWVQVNDWSDFHRGGVIDIAGGNQMLGIKRSVVKNILDNRLCPGDAGFPEMSGAGNLEPYHCMAGNDAEFGLFQPNDISNTTETNTAAYIRLDFGFDDLKYPITGNVGLRYVKLERESSGYITTAEIDKNYTPSTEAPPSGLTTPLTGDQVRSYMAAKIADGTYANEYAFQQANSDWLNHGYNWLSESDKRYGNSASGWALAESDYDAVLPSLNVKVDISDDLIGRFAYAKAVAYPDMGDVRNNVRLGFEGVTLSTQNYVVDVDGTDQNVKIPTGIAEIGQWTGSGGNTYLQPMEANQFDASLEWYFAPSGSLTTTLFYKDIKNFFIQGAMPQRVSNPAYPEEIRTVDVTTTRNGGDGKVYGYELAYQQFFDFLPSPYDGFGIQATYTKIESDGVPNNEEDYANSDWTPVQDDGQDHENDTGARVNLANVPLQGQSDETINFTLMYEKYDWQLRAAYNWRSKYLLTTRDVISKYPLWSDDIGMLDASIMYNINDNITIGLQGTNLTNEQTKTLMILNDEGMTAGRSWFVMDRRYTLSLRAKF
jgi:iron complex outermembrane receptor protein